LGEGAGVGRVGQVGDVLVAHAAPAGAHFQEVHGFKRLHELLVGDQPARRHRGEGAVAVVGREYRRPVAAHAGRQQVAP
nr:hypothetical protein [Tanacetum cinerariifolium]